MTLGSRNRIVWAGLFLSVLSFAGSLYLLSLIHNNSAPRLNFFSGTALWWHAVMSSSPQTLTLLIWTALAALTLTLLAVIITTLIIILFHRTTSPEIFFFNLFILSFAANGLRILALYGLQENMSFSYGLLLSRGMLFFYSFGVFSIFAGSLFSAGLPYQRFSILLTILFGIALTFSTLVPLESTQLYTNLLYLPTQTIPAGMIFLTLEIFSVLNYIKAGFFYSNQDYFALALAVLLALAGYELLFFLATPGFIILGFFLLISGASLFINRTYTIYLWL